MHVRQLIREITRVCGEPSQSEYPNMYRWEIPPLPPAQAIIHLCVTVEDSTRRASIWVFDPGQPSIPEPKYFELNDAADVERAMTVIRQMCPVAMQGAG